MAEFTSSQPVSPFATNAVNVPAAIEAGQTIQANALANAGVQQFRDNTAGLVARDPTATAAALAGNPQAATAFLQSIPNLDQNTRQQFASDVAASASAAGSILNLPPDQRAAAWPQARQQLIAGGHTNVPPADYPGDHALIYMRGFGLTAQDQLDRQAQVPTTTPQSPMQGTPGGGYVGPGGTSSGSAGTTPPMGASDTSGSPPGFQQQLGQSESSNNSSAMNAGGYVGRYQFGTGRLSDLGLYQPAQGENPNGNKWQGQFTIPGFPQVRTLADFQGNPAAQDAAYGAHIDNVDQVIAATPGAQNYDQSGLLAVAHLGGVNGMQQFIATGGKYNPADANGTTLADYYNAFSGHHTGQLLTGLQQNGTAGVRQFVAGGGKYTADGPVPPPQAPTQVASNTGAAGAPPTATDASPPMSAPNGPAPAPPAASATAPQASSAGFQNMLSGIYAPAAPPVSAMPNGGTPAAIQAPVAPTQQPAGATAGASPTFPLSLHDPNAGMVPHATGGPNVGAPLPAGAAGSGSFPVPPNALLSTASNPLGGSPQLPAQNLLAGGTSPLVSPAAPGSQNALLQPSAPPAQASSVRPLYRGSQFIPIPDQPGYVMGVDPTGNRVAMRLPGSPGKGVDTKFVGGTAVQTDNSTGAIVGVVPNLVPDPSRMSSVAGSYNGQNGTIQYQDGKVVGFVPASTQPIQMAAYNADVARAPQVAQAATDAEQQVQRAIEARNYATGLPTGAGGEDRAALSTWLKTYAPTSVYQGFVKSGYLPDAPEAEEAAKIMLSQAAMDEKTMGGSGGLGLTEKYAKANPSLNMTPQAIQDMSNLKAVTAQSAKDYSDGFLNYFNQQQKNFTQQGGTYQPASNFDQAWHSGKNVQVYMAATNAMNGQPYTQWSKGLAPGDQQRALAVIGRIDPTSVVNGAQGRIQVNGQPQQAAAPLGSPSAPAVGTVQAGYRFNGGDPSSPSSWGRVQ